MSKISFKMSACRDPGSLRSEWKKLMFGELGYQAEAGTWGPAVAQWEVLQSMRGSASSNKNQHSWSWKLCELIKIIEEKLNNAVLYESQLTCIPSLLKTDGHLMARTIEWVSILLKLRKEGWIIFHELLT